MKLLPALLVGGAALLPLPSSLLADSFEGTVTMQVTTPEAGALTLNESMKSGLMRIDTQVGPMGAASVILDMPKHQMTVLMPKQKIYMIRPMPTLAQAGAEGQPSQAPAAPEDASSQFQKTAETAQILGYKCTKYTFKGPKDTAEIWVTDELGTFSGFGPGGPGAAFGGRGAGAPGWESALKGGNFFPLKVVSTSSSGKTTTIETTAIQKQSLPDSDFAPPEGWRDMSAMMQGMMPGGMPGSR